MNNVRFGLIGFGLWGRHHARAIAKTAGAELVAVAARSDEGRAAAKKAHPDCHVLADWRDLLRRDDLDVIDVVLPSHLHFEVGEAALQAGRHLLLEKPMAIRSAECRRLTELAREQGLLLGVGFELRLSELWGKMKRLIDAGDVGEPLYAVIELWRRPYRPGSEGWRFDIDRVGSWILEEPIHFFDLARWYFGSAGEPQAVYACANSKQPGHPELHDNFSAVLKFPGGGHAVITQTLAAYEHHQAAKLTGTQGTLWGSWSGAMDRDPHPKSSLRHFDG
ncbi:MAG: Gfo/Idh/MocA family protein, partial [Vicinamibacterales bacterium]